VYRGTPTRIEEEIKRSLNKIIIVEKGTTQYPPGGFKRKVFNL